MSQEAIEQSKRVIEYFRGEAGQQRYEELVHYAECHVRRVAWISGRCNGILPTGQSGWDILHEALLDVTSLDDSGECRRRIPASVPLPAALRKIVRSKISHAIEASATQLRADRIMESQDGCEVDTLESDKPFWQPDGDRMSAEAKESARERCGRFIEFAKADRVVYSMLVLLRDEDLDKPAERVASRLGVNVAEIYTARKRLATLVRRFLETEGLKR
jgi:hypothetical protein